MFCSFTLSRIDPGGGHRHVVCMLAGERITAVMFLFSFALLSASDDHVNPHRAARVLIRHTTLMPTVVLSQYLILTGNQLQCLFFLNPNFYVISKCFQMKY